MTVPKDIYAPSTHANPDRDNQITIDRRAFIRFATALAAAGAIGAGSASAQEVVAGGELTSETIRQALAVAGLEFTDEEIELMLRGVKRNRDNFAALREIEPGNFVAPALYFRADPEGVAQARPQSENGAGARGAIEVAPPIADPPERDDEIAFLSIAQLASFIRAKRLSPIRLAEIYLDRLKQYGGKYRCVISLTEERAMEQARRAEREIAEGKWRGPLHGIPWGAKDLLATRGVRTTWGAKPFENQMIDDDATVVRKLDEAGAVLVAKLSMGALAQGDVWYSGRTLNPWNTERGSSGSSAGPAAATAAGLVAFSIGTETLGSIVSPATVCGVSGLRPTFGRVSRAGAMALSWSMDKIGPMCRSAEDCALVFDAIHGADGLDPTAVTRPFDGSLEIDLSGLRFGYDKSAFEGSRNEQDNKLDRESLAVLRNLGAELVEIKLPDYPLGAIRVVLSAEAAAAFDGLTRSNQDDLLRQQHVGAWPNTFRTARTVPAVEYIQAQRVRTNLMRDMDSVMKDFDLYVTPSRRGVSLTLTNLTGHPCVVVPNGFIEGTPRSISFIGQLFDEGRLLAVARAYQGATEWHEKHPIIA